MYNIANCLLYEKDFGFLSSTVKDINWSDKLSLLLYTNHHFSCLHSPILRV